MMAGEIQEPFNLSLLENSIHSGSISFGRFEKEDLSWEKRSSFSHNRYLEEAEKFSKPGSVTQMRAHFEAHFKKKGIRFPSSQEAQTWGEVVHQHHHHHQTCNEKDENLWESTSQCSHNSYEQDKYDQEKSPFGDSCVSYEDNLVNSEDGHSSHSVALDKTEIGHSEMSLEDKEETTSSSAVTSKPSKMVKKASTYSVATKASTKKHVVLTKESPRCKTKSSIDSKRETKLKPKGTVKSIASQAPISKKTESLTPLATTKDKRTAANGFSFRTKERDQKKKGEKVEVLVSKALNFKARPMPKSIQARPQHTSKGQAKAREDAKEHSSKASSDQSMANGTAKSKLNINKKKVDIQKSLNGILRPKSSDQTARNNANRRSLAVRRSAVEVAL
ncbi:hypothetical protein EUTSA_v10007872mg [Eutrema salsugineum]|uniref:TPX2 C-terminal domain-containing protein n=1 Tax=Eutrema salsugineum TaxID=72664 RepID=V4MRU9_EUTSA|nr:protein WVD2-like 7 [Eutrema salsugineum]ESQ34481.1 hypothetical protein EUTSA_v10007872mg [Eutrema salsugineum]